VKRAIKLLTRAAVGAALLAVPLSGTPIARADPQMDGSICQYFGAHGGVNALNMHDLSQALFDRGLSVDQSNLAIVAAVQHACPKYWDAVIAMYNTTW